MNLVNIYSRATEAIVSGGELSCQTAHANTHQVLVPSLCSRGYLTECDIFL